MAKAQDGPAPISEESIGYLEEVKKGKPRKFAMICKGTSVVSLVVYKKGNVEKRRKEAKESGKGQFYFGVIDGKGMDLRFVLARADGFESPPVKSTSLKGFLDESAELKCKPYFEIVDAAPLVLDEDDPLVARFLKLQEAASQACEAHPDRTAEINTLCRQIGSQLDQDQPDQASVNLDALESLLGGLGGAVSTAAPATVDDGLAAKLVEGLKNLKPLLEKAVAQHPGRKVELIASFTQVRDEIKNQQLTQARTDLIGLGKLLQSLVASPVASSPKESSPKESSLEDKPQVSDEMAQWKEKVAAWGPAIKTAIAAKGPNAADMMKLLSQASVLSKPGGNISEALAKLTECYTIATDFASVGEAASEFNELLRAVLPAIKAAIGTPAGNEAKLKANEAGIFARDKNFAQASSLLAEVKALLTADAYEAKEGTTNTHDEAVEEQKSAAEEQDAQQIEWRRKLASVETKVFDAQKNRAGEAQWMTMLMSAQERADEGNFEKALELLARIEELLNTTARHSPGLEAALNQWTQVRSIAIEELKALEIAIREMEDPESNQAIILLKAIQANLSPLPSSLQAVNELDAYVRYDQIMQDAESPNGLGIDVNIRVPLIAALAELRKQLTA